MKFKKKKLKTNQPFILKSWKNRIHLILINVTSFIHNMFINYLIYYLVKLLYSNSFLVFLHGI